MDVGRSLLRRLANPTFECVRAVCDNTGAQGRVQRAFSQTIVTRTSLTVSCLQGWKPTIVIVLLSSGGGSAACVVGGEAPPHPTANQYEAPATVRLTSTGQWWSKFANFLASWSVPASWGRTVSWQTQRPRPLATGPSWASPTEVARSGPSTHVQCSFGIKTVA